MGPVPVPVPLLTSIIRIDTDKKLRSCPGFGNDCLPCVCNRLCTMLVILFSSFFPFSIPDRIHISYSTFSLLKKCGRFQMISRGKLHVKVAQWSRMSWNRDVSNGPLARPLARSLTRSRARGTVEYFCLIFKVFWITVGWFEQSNRNW